MMREKRILWRSTEFLGKKVGMTQLFDDKGDVHPITVLQAGPCVVTQKKSQAKEGYDAAQIGLIEFVKESRLTQPERGHLAKHNLPPVRFLREVGITTDGAGDGAAGEPVKVGDKVLVDIFQGEKFVDVIGTSKGRGLPAWSSGTISRAGRSRTDRCSRSPGRSVRRRFPRACSRACACPDIWGTRG